MNVRRVSSTTRRSGVRTRRMLTCSWSRSTSFIAISPRATRCTSSIAPADGRPREKGRAAATIRLCCGNALSSHQRADVGEGQQAQRLAGRRAVDDDHVVEAVVVVAADLQQAEQLVHAGQDGQLLGGDAVDALAHEQVAEPVLDLGPVAVQFVLGARPAGRRGRGTTVRRAASPPSRPATSARLCAGSVETSEGAPPARGEPARGRGRDRRLADAALARVEDRPRSHRGEDTPLAALSPRARAGRAPSAARTGSG